MAKILHTADFHLDSAFTALPEEKARLRRQEARQLTDRLVDYANDHGVELLLLAGDLFDSDQLYGPDGTGAGPVAGPLPGPRRHRPRQPRLLRRLQPLRPAAVAGKRPHLPGGAAPAAPFPQYGCVVYGAASPPRRSRRDPRLSWPGG